MVMTEKYYMFGLKHPLDIFRQPKNGPKKIIRIGKIIGRTLKLILYTL